MHAAYKKNMNSSQNAITQTTQHKNNAMALPSLGAKE